MANVLDREKQQPIVALGRQGWSLRQIQEATGVCRETASRYLKAAGVAVRRPGRWGHADPRAAIEVITDSGSMAPARPGRSPTASACEPYRELVERGVEAGRDAMSIWRDLVDDHGFANSYQSVRRFAVKLHGERSVEAHPVIETAPGEEGQVDYGDGPMVRHPETRKYRRISGASQPTEAVWLRLGTAPSSSGILEGSRQQTPFSSLPENLHPGELLQHAVGQRRRPCAAARDSEQAASGGSTRELAGFVWAALRAVA
jgi:hypothetical protein